MPKPGDHVPEEYLRAAVEDNTPVKPEMVKESAKTELPEGHHPQRRLFKRTRGGEVLSREQVAEIKAGRRKLRGDMRKHGIRGKEQFELTAASLGLYFDKRRGLLFWLLKGRGGSAAADACPVSDEPVFPASRLLHHQPQRRSV